MTQSKKSHLGEDFKASFDVNASIPGPSGGKDHSESSQKTPGQPAPSLSKAQMMDQILSHAHKMTFEELGVKYKQFFDLMDGGDATAAHNRGTITPHTVKEDLDPLFNGQELSEEFKNKASTLFEAAVSLRVTQMQAHLEEEFEQALVEAETAARSELDERLEQFLDYVAEQWITENKLAVVSGIRADILESFLGSLKNVFQEHYIEVPEDKVDVVESLTTKVVELENRLNESESMVIAKNKQIQEMEAAKVLTTVSEGLTETQVEKLKSLSEAVSYTTAEEYQTKLKTIVEGFVVKKAPVQSATEQLNEHLDLDAGEKQTIVDDPIVAAAAARLSQLKK
jgi:hypothetical protein